MVPLIITAVLVSSGFIILAISPVYGVAFLSAFRTLSILANVPIGKYEYSAEGFLTLVVIVVGLLFVVRNMQSLRGVLKWPFLMFILFSGLTLLVADDGANFSKKIARLIGYFILYLMVAQLSSKEKNRKILSYAFVASLILTNIPAIYVYYINPARYMQQIYSSTQSLTEVGIMPKNNFGFFSCYMVFFLMYLYSVAKTNASKIIFLFLLLFQAALLVMSYTRSAWIGFMIALPLFLFYSKNRARLLVPFLTILIIGASLSSVIYYGAYKDLTEKREYGFSSWHYRTAYAWPASIKAFEMRPIMGWGLGNDFYALKKAANFDNSSHNDYLLVLVETGGVGLILYLLLLGSLLWRTIRGIRHAGDEQSRMLCVSALAIFVSFLIGSVGEHLLQTPGATGYVITILGMAHGTLPAAGNNVVHEPGQENIRYSPPLPV
ncbi:MAG: O-antigen ligase family protein [Nitrospirota bacterium]